MGENESHRLTAQHASEPVKKQIREWFDNQAQGGNLVVEKNPRNSLRVSYVKKIFPEAKFIHIVRDGRDVACSLVPGCGGVEWRHLKPPSWQEYYLKFSGAIRCAHVWKQVVETTLGDLQNVPHLQIRYEDLLASPQLIAKEIFNFLEIDLHAKTLEFCSNITNKTSSSYQAKFQDQWYRNDHSIRVGRWNENLTKEEIKVINPLLKPLLTQLGYHIESPLPVLKHSINLKRKQKNVKKSSRLIVVLGMHRSGTSAITRGLQVMDVELGDKFLPPQDDNVTGFWEDMDLNGLNIEMLNTLNSDWHFITPIQQTDVDILRKNGYIERAVEMLQKKTSGVEVFGFKDPRVAKLLPFWKEVFAHSNLSVSYVLAVRHPRSVCESLAKRNGFDPEKGYLLWLNHMISSLVGTIGEHCIVVDFDRLLQFPDKELKRLAKGLQLKIDPFKLEKFKTEFLDQALRHTAYQIKDLMSEDAIPSLVRAVYLEVFNITRDKLTLNDPAFKKKIGQWDKEFLQQKSPLILADKLSLKLSSTKLKLEHSIAELDQSLFEKELIINSRGWKFLEKIRRVFKWFQ